MDETRSRPRVGVPREIVWGLLILIVIVTVPSVAFAWFFLLISPNASVTALMGVGPSGMALGVAALMVLAAPLSDTKLLRTSIVCSVVLGSAAWSTGAYFAWRFANPAARFFTGFSAAMIVLSAALAGTLVLMRKHRIIA